MRKAPFYLQRTLAFIAQISLNASNLLSFTALAMHTKTAHFSAVLQFFFNERRSRDLPKIILKANCGEMLTLRQA